MALLLLEDAEEWPLSEDAGVVVELVGVVVDEAALLLDEDSPPPPHEERTKAEPTKLSKRENFLFFIFGSFLAAEAAYANAPLPRRVRIIKACVQKNASIIYVYARKTGFLQANRA